MNIEKLKACGVDYEDGLQRFSGYAAIYEKHLRKFTGLTLMKEVEEAINRCELNEAFEACHKLKAYVGNLSMPALYEEVCELTDWLRAGRTRSLTEKYQHLSESYNQVLEGVREALEDER